MKKALYTLACFLFLHTYLSAQTTSIPDANFEQALISLNIDSDGVVNGVISTADAEAATQLKVGHKNIADLTGIEAFINLTLLECFSNQLTSLDFSNNTSLTEVNCSRNQLTSLNISTNTNLTDLYCNNNQLTDLDVSTNTNLTHLYCYDNQLTDLNVSTNTNLIWLSCGVNPLTTLDVSNITSLVRLECNTNQLTTLDLSNNTNLAILNCESNQLSNLNVSLNTNLQGLNCNANQLTNLNLSNNTHLLGLECGSNPLTALDVSSNTNLSSLECYSNQLTALDVSMNTKLTHLYCYDNQLIDLNVSTNTNLSTLICQSNQLTALDVSLNTNLRTINCSSNQLSYLNIKNGNNTHSSPFSSFSFNATNNSELNCIIVDDVNYAETNFTDVDMDVTFVTAEVDCPAPVITLIPDTNFEQALIDLNIDSDGVINGKVFTADAEMVTELSINNKNISDLTGIEAFTHLTTLECFSNQLTSLDLSMNTNLETLFCENNQLATLNISMNTDLETLNCSNNPLGILDVSMNTNLTSLFCSSNQLTTLDVSMNTILSSLWCNHNQLTTLDLAMNTNLETLLCYSNQLTTLDLSMNTSLTNLDARYNSLTALDLTTNTSLTSINCAFNQLTSLNIKNDNNNNLSFLNTTSNSNLDCIIVDDVNYAENNFTFVDMGVTFVTTEVDCPTCTISAISITNISDCQANTLPSTFTANVTVTFTDVPTTGTLILSGDGSANINVDALNGSTHTFMNVTMIADGSTINLTATFSEDIDCTFNNSNAGIAPEECYPPFTLSLSGPSTFSEMTNSTNTQTYTVNRSGSTLGAVSVEFIIKPYGTNTVDNNDFNGTPFTAQTINFTDGEATKTFDLSINTDSDIERDETFIAQIQNINKDGFYGNSFLFITLKDDDALPIGLAGVDILNSCETTVQLGEIDLGTDPGTGSWSILSNNGGSLNNVNEYHTDFTGVAGESYQLQWDNGSEVDMLHVSFAGDSDNDGVNDCEDRCPLFRDDIDHDMDGAPDACDCDPNNANDAEVILPDGTMMGGVIPSDRYESSGIIESIGTIPAGNNVTYKAAVSITLRAGFNVEANALFYAHIAPCTYNPDYEIPFFDNNEVVERFTESNQTNLPTAFHVTIQPNPVRDIVQIGFELTKDNIVSMDVFNTMGRQIAMPIQQQTRPAGKHLHGLNVSHLPVGIYYVRVRTKDAQQMVKMMVQR